MQPTTGDSESLLMTAAEAARELQVHKESVYRLIRAREIPSVKVGSAVRIPRAALLAWISDQQQSAA